VTITETRRRPLLFGRRKGPKSSARQERLREALLPEIALLLKAGCDPRTYFSCSVREVWLEVGFGGGEHLIWQARQNPHVGLIGAEPYGAGVAKLLSQIDDVRNAGETISNVRIHEGDARDIIQALPRESLGRVFILFPDPWPKTRHHKRRFIQEDMLDALARVMRKDAEFRFATDDAGYLRWTLERLVAHKQFVWTAERAKDWTTRPPDWPQTRYEAKALHGPPLYLRFLRR
jgi:tRNA (guanine-N7-)-methyltransferase